MKVAVTILVFCVAALLALGMVMLYSSSMAQVGAHYLAMQLVWCVLGLAAGVVTTMVDYRQLKRIWWVPLGIAVLMLALVLNKHFGARINGARRWFSFGGMHFQPSEFAKIALIIALAWYGEHFQRQMPLWKRGILIPGLLIGLTVGLIFKEPDVGNALVLAAVSGVLLLIAGIRLKYFLPPVLAVALGVGVLFHLLTTRCVPSAFIPGCTWRRPGGTKGCRLTRRWLRSAAAASPARAWATAARSSASCRSTTRTLSFPSSARSLG